MAFPESARLEVPILQELLATGGEEKVKVLYQRLIPYFPQLTEKDLRARTKTRKNQWKTLVQRAGERLVKKGELKRLQGRWVLTESGRQQAEAEKMLLDPPSGSPHVTKRAVSHGEIQTMLVEVGRMLGKYAAKEYQRYDVVWKESEFSPRLSHVFEVQVKGKIEQALAKLKHAYDLQRSKPFLVLSDERDERRARQFLQPFLSGSFHEIGAVTTVLSVEEIERMYHALSSIKSILQEIFT
ncbi:winged helix-turn-helix domain-containing protein [candidate division KSB1 bacterium]|nr:winged helix-turn-helix domain-containing protein [candidate division KSB1 bacterium]